MKAVIIIIIIHFYLYHYFYVAVFLLHALILFSLFDIVVVCVVVWISEMAQSIEITINGIKLILQAMTGRNLAYMQMYI